MEEEIIRIKELDVDIIHPRTKMMNVSDHGGSKIVMIGKPGTGKSTIMRSVLYEKSHIIPVGMVMSGTEDSNHFFGRIFPDIYIHSEYSEDAFASFIERQKLAKEHLENPWAVVILDDVTDDVSQLKSKLMLGSFKNGRHFKMLKILSLQYALDVLPPIRTSIDGTFILREPIAKNRKILYENYASIIPTFDLFNQIMDEITSEYTALYIHNNTQTNKWQECVFYYNAKEVPENFEFGCWEIYRYNEDRHK